MPPIVSTIRTEKTRFNRSLRGLILICWALLLLLARSQPLSLSLMPPLAFITFMWLPPLPIFLISLLLSAYLDSTAGLPPPQKIVLLSVIWLAALVVVVRAVLKQRQYAVELPPDDDERAAPPAVPPAAPVSTTPGDAISTLRHDLRTPIKMIEGFCEALLRPSSAHQPLPDVYRTDIEAILRNAQQLDGLIATLLRDPALLPSPHNRSDTRATVILLDADGAVFDLLSLYTSRLTVIRVRSVEEIGRVGAEIEPTAVIIADDDTLLIPLVVQIVGEQIPILMLRLVATSSTIRYLSKPVEFDALEAALKGNGMPLREVLIIDDNRDNVDLLSRMILSMPEAPRLLKVYSGREALALLKERVPDVIFLDLILPDIDGRLILGYLHSDMRLARVPVVLMSAHRPLDMLTMPRASKLTLLHLAGLSPVKMAQRIESLIADITNESA